jgi:hypothetical protein
LLTSAGYGLADSKGYFDVLYVVKLWYILMLVQPDKEPVGGFDLDVSGGRECRLVAFRLIEIATRGRSRTASEGTIQESHG